MITQDIQDWLKNKLKASLDTKTYYMLTFTANTGSGPQEIKIELDLIWFVMIQAEDTVQKKIQVVNALLQEKDFLEQFKNTLSRDNIGLKRLLSEFLLYNNDYLVTLSKYIDFNKLSVPTDFVSHAIFIKLSDTKSILEQDNQRLFMVNTILDSGFKLDPNTPNHAPGAAIRKILLMEVNGEKFKTVRKLLDAGYKVFNQDKISNAEIGAYIIKNRENQDCLAILNKLKNELKAITLPIAGSKSDGNLADYFYWVKEDLKAVEFLKNEIGLEPSN